MKFDEFLTLLNDPKGPAPVDTVFLRVGDEIMPFVKLFVTDLTYENPDGTVWSGPAVLLVADDVVIGG